MAGRFPDSLTGDVFGSTQQHRDTFKMALGFIAPSPKLWTPGQWLGSHQAAS